MRERGPPSGPLEGRAPSRPAPRKRETAITATAQRGRPRRMDEK